MNPIDMIYTIDSSSRVAIVGSGSWATALTKIILENDGEAGWFVRDREDIDYIDEHRTNPRYLRDVYFNSGTLRMSEDINEVVAAADIIILAVPSVYLKVTLEPLTVPLRDKFVVSAIKGIVPDDYVTVAEYVNRKYEVPFDRIGIISGPCHAEEVALERLSYLTVVCKDIDNAAKLGGKLKRPYINITPSTDIYGTEYASVLKNIYAISVGIANGLGYGDNFMAVLISNGAREMSYFLEKTYPSERNTFDSAYLGDLLVTSYSQFSRNRTFGVMVGKGYPVSAIRIENDMVAEGYYGAACIRQINSRLGLSLPIADTVYDILYGGAHPATAMTKLTKKLI